MARLSAVVLAVLLAVGVAAGTTPTHAYDDAERGWSFSDAGFELAAGTSREDAEAPPEQSRHAYDDRVNLARASARLTGYRLTPRAISAGDEVASSAAQGARLTEHLRLSERYGAGGVRELADGRVRYYGELTPAAKPGDMAGARLVREWNPAADRYRTWYETLDHAGRVRQVHPYQPYSPHHYWFDEFGNYGGRR